MYKYVFNKWLRIVLIFIVSVVDPWLLLQTIVTFTHGICLLTTRCALDHRRKQTTQRVALDRTRRGAPTAAHARLARSDYAVFSINNLKSKPYRAF